MKITFLVNVILCAFFISNCATTIHNDRMKQTTCDDFVQSLLVKRSRQTVPDSMKLFGQFVGSWDWAGFDYLNDGSKLPTKGRWIFEWVLNGNAIQDVFIFEDPDSDKEHVSFAEYGTTIRFPTNDGNTWKAVWVGPMNKVIRILDARVIGSDIVLEGKNERGELIHWIFSHITETSFHWRGEYTSDSGRSWILYEELDTKRR